jgi:ERCC4-related helicase
MRGDGKGDRLMPPEGWKSYLEYLDGSSYSMDLLTTNLSPSQAILELQWVKVGGMKYSLFPFQQKILDRVGGDALVVGLPTGLGKTYVAGAYIARESAKDPCRVLFLTPSIPLGVQQALFARKMLGLDEACFISGSIHPEKRKAMKVWNAGFAVTTPQTFYNDVLKGQARAISAAKGSEDAVDCLRDSFRATGFTFPYTILVADECHGYIGETDGYSILLAAKASGTRILALSATPQLHAPSRLRELKRVFGQIEVFSVEEPEIKAHMPERVIGMITLDPPPRLLQVYYQLSEVVGSYQDKAKRLYGAQHARGFCSRHPLCILLISLRVMKTRLVEDGASSVLKYGNWELRELNRPLPELDGKTIYEAYREALKINYNHKLSATLRILEGERYKKAIVFIESVEGAKQLGSMLHKRRGMEDVAVLVGKGGMNMEQQASALLQFRDRASILVCTSIGEEGLDIPAADIEVWVDPPSNPKKWIQRFGRILRQSGGKKTAKTYALVTSKTHERNKLLRGKAKVEGVYGFTQRVEEEDLPGPLPKEQKTLSQFL